MGGSLSSLCLILIHDMALLSDALDSAQYSWKLFHMFHMTIMSSTLAIDNISVP